MRVPGSTTAPTRDGPLEGILQCVGTVCPDTREPSQQLAVKHRQRFSVRKPHVWAGLRLSKNVQCAHKLAIAVHCAPRKERGRRGVHLFHAVDREEAPRARRANHLGPCADCSLQQHCCL